MSGGGDEETPDQTVVVPDIETKVEAEAEAEAETKTEAKPEAGINTFGAGTVKGQYVRLWQGQPYQTQDAYALNILELEVYDNSGTNIAQGKSATSSSQYPGDHQPVLAFDGSLDTKYRSNYDVEEDWLEVDLGSVIEIHKIVIKHTGSEDVYEGVAMKDGLRGYIEIFDGNGSIGKTTQIAVTSTDDVYTYNFKERGGGKWRGGQGLLKSREDIIAKKQASDAAAAEAKAKADAAAEKAAAEKAAADKVAADLAAAKARVEDEKRRLAYLGTISGKAGAGAYATVADCWAEAKDYPDWGNNGNNKAGCCKMDWHAKPPDWKNNWKRDGGEYWCMENTG
jgi:hypothetical protein|tara:strand:- start:1241 stop:2257 length:1017 start_codon:yes stop_codon:yes gene_type:complete